MVPRQKIDYKSLGFACGLEVHQRLATSKKLFCGCDAGLSASPVVSGSIIRSQRAVAGELGKVDFAAKFEEEKKRIFRYNIFDYNTCLVELDEEPPHDLNREALQVALSISQALNLNIVDEIQPMRKEVVDGSNPSAFQRTIMLGSNGSVKLDGRSVPITMISLEEESAGIEERKAGETIYDTDRIGIPLVEIDTDPSIASPEEARDVALKIGTLLRLTGRVQRGIGTIRQDVNVSIKSGARVEIKGVQELDVIDKLVENEVLRQVALIEIRDRLLARKAEVGRTINVTSHFKDTGVRILRNHLDNGSVVLAFALKGFKGLVGTEIGPNRRLGSEISDYAKGAGVNGIIHSDENLSVYGFTEREIEELKKILGVAENDAFVMIAGGLDNAWKASELATDRAKYAMVGVPAETRAVLNANDGTTRFMRPLPGGSRMYPETDLKPVRITSEMISLAKRNAPDIDRERSILEKQAGQRNAEELILSPRLSLYRFLVNTLEGNGELVANILLQKFTELKRSGFEVDSIPESKLLEMFKKYSSGEITKQAIEEVLKALTAGLGVEEAIRKNKLERIKGENLSKLVDSERKSYKSKDELIRAIMSKYRLNIDGGELNSMLATKHG